MRGFYEHVAHRAVCDDCGELHLVAVVKRGRFPDVRVCEKCFRLRNWVKPEWRDARWQRHRANRLSKELGQALAERDRARDLAVALEQQAAYHEQVASGLDAAWKMDRIGWPA